MERHEYRIVVLGQDGVGKTALSLRMVIDKFHANLDPTVEDSYRKQVKVDGTDALLDILDTVEVDHCSQMKDQWLREANGFLLVYSITSQQSFNELIKFHRLILRVKNMDKVMDKVPLVIAGNKCDLRDLKDNSQVSVEKAEWLAHELRCPFYETSAKEKIQVEECFYQVVREVRKFEKVVETKRRCPIL